MVVSISMRFSILVLALLLPSGLAQVPGPPTNWPAADSVPVQLTAAEDHRRMLDLLHITALRPGVSQNGQGPNPVNWDESKANPWPNLPNPLVLNNGKPVKTAKVWWTERRPQLVELFDRDILGRVPANVPAVHWEVASTTARNLQWHRRRSPNIWSATSTTPPILPSPSTSKPTSSSPPPRAVLFPSSWNSVEHIRPHPLVRLAQPLPRPSPRRNLPPLKSALRSSSRSSPKAGATRCSTTPPFRPTTALASRRASSASAITASRASSTTGALCAPGPGAHHA